MRVGFYSPYLDTFGGGERYILTLASHLAKKEQVDIFWDDTSIRAPISKYLKIDLRNTNFVDNIFKTGGFKKYLATKKYDCLFVLSDGSVPTTLAKKNVLHFQVPFKIQPSLSTKFKLKKYQHVTVNSRFTKKFIDESFHVNSKVIYPPVDIKALGASKKEKLILSVGRFGNNQLHPKKQEVLIEVFKEVYRKNKDWKLLLVGQAKKEDQKNIRRLRKMSSGIGIKILENISQDKLKEIYAKTSIYWHATGFGEDENKNPQKMEHFGISTVEASASGAVPIVIKLGGQKEIVEHNKNGLLWLTKTQLFNETIKVMEEKTLFKKLSENAIKNSKRFSKDEFTKQYEEIVY